MYYIMYENYKNKQFRIKYHIMKNYSPPTHILPHPSSVPQK